MSAAKDIAAREDALPATAEPTSIVSAIVKMASDPSVDVDKFERMMAMHERMEARQAERAFNDAMNRAQSEVRRVAADATNNQTRSQYATYAALDRALRPVYTEHGFALSFDTGADAPENTVRVLCYVSHRDGHTRTYRVDMPADGKGAKGGDAMTKTHAAGSAMQYGMRYLLKLIFNVAIGEDDDGNVAADTAPRISEKQVADLRALIEEVGADEGKFLAYLKQRFRASGLEDIAEKAYPDVVRALEAKRK